MATRLQILLPVAAAAVIVGVAGMLSIPADVKLESVEFPRGTIRVDDTILEVQIADTQDRRIRGLMFQDELPLDQGMIFVFDSMGRYSMWMLNVQFPLDMIWFDQEGRAVHIEEGVMPCITAVESMTCPSILPDAEALYVLEVTSGFVQANNITLESQLHIISI